MEMFFVTVFACVLCFLCGAAVAYGRDDTKGAIREENDELTEPEPNEREINLREQWAELLDYNEGKASDEE